MTIKTHLTAQEEGVIESGIQLRITEPTSPVDNQVWIRTDLRRIKARIGGQTVVLSRGRTQSLELIGSTLDTSLSDTFYKNIATGEVLTLANLADGSRADIMIYNTSFSNITVSISNQNKWANGEDGVILANSRKLFIFIKVGEDIVISSKAFPV